MRKPYAQLRAQMTPEAQAAAAARAAAMLDLSPDGGLCQGCGKRRVLCAHGMCRVCHQAYGEAASLGHDRPMHLCCGWYATGTLLESWTCLTCGKVHEKR